MSALRFFQAGDLTGKHKLWLDQHNSHKVLKVLRLTVGSKIYIFNNTNKEYLVSISSIVRTEHKDHLVEVEILEELVKDLESNLKLHLVVAITKHDNMDWIVQKAVELGVTKITPIITARTIAKPKDPQKKTLHWKQIAISACCQCGRNILPEINKIFNYSEFIEHIAFKNANKLMVTPVATHADSSVLTKFYNLKNLNLDFAQEIIIMIGPEGGFNRSEFEYASAKQFIPITLGSRILRAETAAIASICGLQVQYGDLGM